MKSLLLALAVLVPQEDAARIKALVEKLGSDSVADRDDAERDLIKMGPAAAPHLQKAATDADAEVAARVKYILRIVELREKVPARLRAAFPGVEERLARGTDRTWMELFQEVTRAAHQPRIHDALEIEDVDFLASRALRGAEGGQEKYRLGHVAGLFGLRSAIPELVLWLDDPDHMAQHAAFQGLRALKPVECVPQLLELMKGTNRQRSALVQQLLGEMKARNAVPGLLKLLEDADPITRANAAVALGTIGGEEVLAPLLARLKDPDAVAVRSIAHGLALLGDRRAIPGLRDLLKDTRYSSSAAEALGTLGAREAIPDLIRLAENPESDALIEAAAALAKLNATESVRALVPHLGSKDDDVRAQALASLGLLGARGSAPAVRVRLKDKAEEVRTAAALALGRLKDADSLPALVEALSDESEDVQAEAYRAIEAIGPSAVSPSLIKLLRDAGKPLPSRRSAALLLRGESAGPELRAVAAVKEEPVELRASCVFALGAAGDGGAVEPFLADPAEEVRNSAAMALGRTRRREALPALCARLGDPKEDYDVRNSAARALGALGDPQAVKPLLKALKSEGYEVESALALGRLGAKEAAPELLALLVSEERDKVVASTHALALLDRDGAIAKLKPRLGSSVRAERVRAAEALCRLGVPEAAPQLLEASRRDSEVSLVALNALRRPEDWKRLDREFAAWEFIQDSFEDRVLMGRLAGLPVAEDGDSDNTTFFSSVEAGWDSKLRALEGQSEDFILDEDRLRVPGRPAIRRFWEEWWEKKTK